MPSVPGKIGVFYPDSENPEQFEGQSQIQRVEKRLLPQATCYTEKV